MERTALHKVERRGGGSGGEGGFLELKSPSHETLSDPITDALQKVTRGGERGGRGGRPSESLSTSHEETTTTTTTTTTPTTTTTTTTLSDSLQKITRSGGSGSCESIFGTTANILQKVSRSNPEMSTTTVTLTTPPVITIPPEVDRNGITTTTTTAKRNNNNNNSSQQQQQQQQQQRFDFALNEDDGNTVDNVDQVSHLFMSFSVKPPTLEEALSAMEYNNPGELANTLYKKGAKTLGRLDAPGLTVDDVAIIFCYTFEWDEEKFGKAKSPYFMLNLSLSVNRSSTTLKKTRGFLFLLLSSLRKLPRFVPESRILYRGIRALVQTEYDWRFPDRKPYAAGNEKTWWAFTSTSTSLEITRRFLGAGGGTLVTLGGSSWGYNISVFSDFPEEEEILLEPERTFNISSVAREGQLITVTAEMLDTPLVLSNVVHITKIVKYIKIKKRKIKEMPDDIKVKSVSHDILEVSWQPALVKGKTVAYQAIMRKAGAFNKSALVYEGTGIMCTVDGLEPKTEYVFRVRCGYDGSWGRWSDETSALTTSVGSIILTANVGSHSSISLYWEDKSRVTNNNSATGNNGTKRFYRLEMKQDGSKDFTRIYEGEETSHTERGLTPGKLYNFRVCYVKEDGKTSEWSDTVKKKTMGVPAPQSFGASKRSMCSVDLHWTAIHAKDSSYRVLINFKGATTNAYTAWSGSATECTVNGLVPDTEYEFWVQGMAEKTWGELSTPIATKTLPWSWKPWTHYLGRPNGYALARDNTKKATRTAGDHDWDCAVISCSPIPQNAVLHWGVKITRSRNGNGRNIYVGVAPFDVDLSVGRNFEKCGWYFHCYDSTLCSGPPHGYAWPGVEYGPRKEAGQYTRTGDVVGVVTNTVCGELSFSVNSTDLGVAYKEIPLDKPLVPCIILAYKDDSFELASWHY